MKTTLQTYRYQITPTNEDQPLNYSETFAVKATSEAEARNACNVRENQITAGLMALLPSGSWDCEVEALTS